MPSRNNAGFTWTEALVCLVVTGVLIVLALPAITRRGCGGGPGTQMLSSMKQLHLATQQMVLDGDTLGDTNLGWPGDTGGSFSNWVRLVVPSYLSTNDLCKLLSGPGKNLALGKLPSTMAQSAVLVYAVKEDSNGSTVVFSSANFTNTPVGGEPLLDNAKPFGNTRFIIFRKAGDGAILLPKQVGQTNLIGSYMPLCH